MANRRVVRRRTAAKKSSGRKANGQIKKGYRLSKGGRVVPTKRK